MSVFCISGLSYQALTMQNAFYILSIAWLFRGRCPWENKLSAGVHISKSFLLSSHAPTYLWNSILKTKPIFKAVTIFSFAALHFSWNRETLAKSWILSVKIIILAYSLSFFSWDFIRGIQGGWCSPSELFFQSSPRQLSLGMHPFSIIRLSTQLSHNENVAVSNCVIRYGSIIHDSDANSLVLW